MAVKIRLSRHGRKGVAFYRIVVADKESPRDGRVIEVIGHYDPNSKGSTVKLDREKLDYWVSKGAQCTETVRNLVKKASG